MDVGRFTASDVVVMAAKAIASPALLQSISVSGSVIDAEKNEPTGGDALSNHPTVTSRRQRVRT